MALPFGVLFGVVVGFWAIEIAELFVTSFISAKLWWYALLMRIVPEEIWLPHREFFERFKMLLGVCSTKIGNGVSRSFGYAVMPFRWLATGIRASARVPMQAVRWASHPSSTALLITISTVVVGAAINAFAFAALWPWPEMKTIGGAMSGGKPEQLVPFTFSDIAIHTFFATMLTTGFGIMGVLAKDDRGGGMRDFYARWERYSQYSPITYFARELTDFFKSEVLMTIFAALAIAYWVTLGGALIALVMIPVATFVTFMVGLYNIAQRSAHWWCFGVTLVTTGVSALVFYNSFGNEAVLWTVALCTGLASGVATEGLRCLGLWWSNTEMGQHYLDIWYDGDKTLPFSIATPAWRTLLRAFDNVGQRMIGSVA
jgi:multisubunit Na+/H+ antiporter MnhC subunit